jgi:hypothetical protein
LKKPALADPNPEENAVKDAVIVQTMAKDDP